MYHFDNLSETELGGEDGVCELGRDGGRGKQGRGRRRVGVHRGRTEVKWSVEGGGVVRHGGVEVIEDVRTGERRVELLGTVTGVFRRPQLEGEAGAETVRGTGEEEDEERAELL